MPKYKRCVRNAWGSNCLLITLMVGCALFRIVPYTYMSICVLCIEHKTSLIGRRQRFQREYTYIYFSLRNTSNLIKSSIITMCRLSIITSFWLTIKVKKKNALTFCMKSIFPTKCVTFFFIYTEKWISALSPYLLSTQSYLERNISA